jgi:hypothetical protein
MEPNKDFDHLIRAALTKLEADYDAASWSLLENRLDAPPTSEDLLDGLMSDKLSGLKVPLSKDTWSAFEQRLEAEEAAELIEEEIEIDNLAYEKLQDLEAVTGRSNWPLMEQRIEEEYSLKTKLVRYKVAEMAMVFLFILAIFRLMPLADEFLKENNKNHSHSIDGEDTKAIINQYALTSIGIKYPVFNNISSNSSPAYFTHAIAINVEGNDSFESPMKDQSQELKSRKGLIPAPLSFKNQVFVNSASKMPEVSMLDIWGNSEDALPGKPEASPSEYLDSKISFIASQNTTLELPATRPFKSPSLVRFSLFTTADYNYVFSPSENFYLPDTLVSSRSEFTGGSGYGGGILLNLKKGQFEIQTGGIYSFKRYVPNTPIFLFKTVKYYVEEDFHGIQQDLLQVPVNLQYHYKNAGNWRIYGLLGASFHFITSSVYEIRYKLTPAFSFAPSGAPGSEQRSFLSDKDFPKGLADGGSLKDNLYITANVGFGVERYISPKWSLFVQPNYQHYLNASGIGTNKDKFYTFSMQLGSKVSLK